MSRAKQIARGTVSIVKAEFLFAFGAFWRGLWKTTLAVGLPLFGLVAHDVITAPDAGPVGLTLLVGLGYCLFLGAHVGLLGGALNTAWKMAGAWVLVPLISIPLAVALSLWAFSGLLDAQADAIFAALTESFQEHDWMALRFGPAARIGPPILIILLPVLAADLLLVIVELGVLTELLVFFILLSVAVLVGFVPSAGGSAIVVGVAYAKGFSGRHRETIRGMLRSEDGPGD